MADHKTKKELKKLNKELDELKKLFTELELSPCRSDRELAEKEQALGELREKMQVLDTKRDRIMYIGWKPE